MKTSYAAFSEFFEPWYPDTRKGPVRAFMRLTARIDIHEGTDARGYAFFKISLASLRGCFKTK